MRAVTATMVREFSRVICGSPVTRSMRRDALERGARPVAPAQAQPADAARRGSRASGAVHTRTPTIFSLRCTRVATSPSRAMRARRVVRSGSRPSASARVRSTAMRSASPATTTPLFVSTTPGSFAQAARDGLGQRPQ